MPALRAADLLRSVAEAVPASGASASRRRYREEALALVRGEGLLAAAIVWRIVALDAPAGEILRAGGEEFVAPRLLPEAGRLTALACGVATIGPAIEGRVRALFAERRAALAVALDELGNALLMVASRRVQDRIFAEAKRRGLTMAGELRPGDPGLGLAAQVPLLRLADAASIGVDLSSGLALRPLKSTSMVLGVGVDLPPARWSRCDDCPTAPRCKLAPHRPATAAA